MPHPEKKNGYTIFSVTSVDDMTPQHLIKPYIPLGVITLLQGFPKCGKSSFLIDVAARGSRGGSMFNGTSTPEPFKTLYLCFEMGNPAIMKRMYKNAGGVDDFFLSMNGSGLTIADERVKEAICKSCAKLVVFDSMQYFLNSNINNAQQLADELTDLALFAADQGCAIVLIGHIRKNQSGVDIYNSIGSAEISAACRSILQINHPDRKSPIRYIEQIATNIDVCAIPYAFELTDLGKIEWIGPVDLDDVKDLCKAPIATAPLKRDQAADYITKLLLDHGRMASNEIVDLLHKKGFKDGTIRDARKSIGVVYGRDSERWYWRLPN